jgi:hypothetical protein
MPDFVKVLDKGGKASAPSVEEVEAAGGKEE